MGTSQLGVTLFICPFCFFERLNWPDILFKESFLLEDKKSADFLAALDSCSQLNSLACN